MSVLADIVIIRGAPGAGKSQAAKCLASFFPDGARVEVDVLRKMVISVNWQDQQEHIELLDVAAGLAHDFVGLGFRPVIVVDTFSGDKVNRFLETLHRLDASLAIRIFAMHVSEGVLRQRLVERPSDEFKDFGISRMLNANVLKFRHPTERQVDATTHSPQQTATEIYRTLASESRPGGVPR
jgi:predicted kinase